MVDKSELLNLEFLELKEAGMELIKKLEMDEIKRDLALTNERIEKIKQRLGIN
jgi:hypothetical protein